MKSALVTGHKGFVGRHVSRALSDAGYYVTGVDNILNTPDIGIQREVTMDLHDFFRETLHEGRAFDQPDVIVHCAAVSPHRAAIDNPKSFMGAENLALDSAMFRWVRWINPGHIVYISSSAAYPINAQGFSTSERLTECDINLEYVESPDGIYGWTKLTGEYLAFLANKSGIPTSVVRPFSGYGTDQSIAFPFGAFRNRALSRLDPFKIWGNGSQVRDWVHVDDIVRAILQVIKIRPDKPVNIGTGVGTSMRELAHLMVDAAGYAPEFAFELSAPSGVEYRVCDPTRLHIMYVPKISIEEGVRRAFA